MSKGPSTPMIKRGFEVCKTAGFEPTSITMFASGDISFTFDQESIKSKNQIDSWQVEIDKAEIP